MLVLSLGMLSCVAARSTVGPVLFNPPVSQFGVFPGPTGYAVAPFAASFGGAFPAPLNAPLTASLASPLGNAPGPAPLAVSSSQRLDYFNQFNAAFAPNAPARILAATPTARLIAPGVAAPFFF
ncbi:hypothetical protein KR074_006081 [Drosophila pseudoananassae]|nr:hypothetical protein KR074_006081 [Drosophila pseudoananassae]